MCGIVGLIAEQDTLKSEAFINSSLQGLAHRGPDALGTFQASVDQMQVALGHRRLAILGLGNAANQPMSNENLTITFNGEIYNYRSLCRDILRQSPDSLRNDTDLILRMWSRLGPSCVRHFRGIFAFALFDSRTSKVFLVRDTFGVKPLYFRFNTRSLEFASEPWILRGDENPIAINLKTCSTYLLRAHYDHSQETFFKDVKSLKPGVIESFLITKNSIRREASTQFSTTTYTKTKESFEHATANLRELFIQAVERNLTSDVPVAFALSGGLDSAAIICVARHLFPSRVLSTFSYVPEDEKLSEFRFVKLLAENLDLEVHRCSLEPSSLVHLVSAFVRAQGEPVQSARQLAQFVVFEAAAKKGFRVLIEGQGGDEILAGYHGFIHLRLVDLVAAGRLVAATKLLRNWSKENSSYSVQLVLAMIGGELLSRRPGTTRIEALFRAKITGDNALWTLREAAQYDKKNFWNESTLCAGSDRCESRFRAGLRKASSCDYLPQLLRQGDRNAMAHSVENRVPFLDEDFTAYVETLPDEFLLSERGITKYVFREAMRGLVPDVIIDRKDKVGFQADGGLILPSARRKTIRSNMAPWFRGPDEMLSEAALWRRRSMYHWLEWLEQLQEHDLF